MEFWLRLKLLLYLKESLIKTGVWSLTREGIEQLFPLLAISPQPKTAAWDGRKGRRKDKRTEWEQVLFDWYWWVSINPLESYQGSKLTFTLGELSWLLGRLSPCSSGPHPAAHEMHCLQLVACFLHHLWASGNISNLSLLRSP